MRRKVAPSDATVVGALEALRAARRALTALDLLYRREMTKRVRERNTALISAASHHVPIEELAAAARLSEAYVKTLLRRAGSRY